jgi:hypothetical protein
MALLDLFGDPIQEAPERIRPGAEYKKGAYPAKPGTGPEGMTCRQCIHYCVREYHRKYYRKCGLMRGAWTHGSGSDIRAGSPACAKFEAEAGHD